MLNDIFCIISSKAFYDAEGAKIEKKQQKEEGE